jgi:serine/threonine protein kinase
MIRPSPEIVSRCGPAPSADRSFPLARPAGRVRIKTSAKARGRQTQRRGTPVAEEVIGGYQMLRHLVTGQTSQVWEVVEANSGRHFAMKLLLPEKLHDSASRRFLLHEAKVGIELTHANIIRIVKVGEEPKNPYFVMDFFPAGNLKLRVMHREVAFIREKAQDIFKQAATALAFMNAKRFVHRDVKPDNILVANSGDVRIIDFALTQRMEKPSFFSKLFRRKPKPQGTRSYMSPEQIRGEPLDGRADIYSFAATAFEVITTTADRPGRPPFVASTSHELLTKHLTDKPVTPQTFNRDVTDQFSQLLLRMLAKKREDRPRDFHEVLMKMRTMKVFKG